jgi:hypothetical protein
MLGVTQTPNIEVTYTSHQTYFSYSHAYLIIYWLATIVKSETFLSFFLQIAPKCCTFAVARTKLLEAARRLKNTL